MLWTFIVLLLVLWMFGLAFKIAAGFIHILLVVALVLFLVNLLSGRRSELAPALGAHRDLNAIVDAAGDPELSAELDRLASETIKRVRHGAAATTYDEAVGDALTRLETVTELKTAWHPIGA